MFFIIKISPNNEQVLSGYQVFNMLNVLSYLTFTPTKRCRHYHDIGEEFVVPGRQLIIY